MAVSHPLEHVSAHTTSTARSIPAPDFLAGGGEMGRRMRAYDWNNHSLGPPAQWPQSLKTLVRVMLDSRYAMWMLWGPEITFFCNDAYLPTVGLKREWVLGSRADRVWEEIWPDIGPRIRQVLERGESTWDEALLLFLERSGFSEETYHTFSYSPVYDDDGRIAGMLCVVTEVTESVLAERRLHSLRELGARASFMERTSTAHEACRVAVETLAQNPADVPFAAALLLQKEGSVRPVAAAGVDLASLGLAQASALDNVAGRWPLTEVLASGQGQSVEELAELRISAGRWSQIIERAFVTPVTAPGHDGVAAVLVLGLSPRLKFDDRYRSFLEQAAVFLGQAITNARAYEEERRRAEALAEIDRAKTAFFSNVSHEFRTPLTLLLGPIEELLRQPHLAHEERGRLELAHRNCLRLLKLVNSLLDFSRLEAGKVRAHYEAVNLAAHTADLASTFRSAMERAGLEFEVDCPKLAQPVYVDREMWEKVVLNLLSNAFKFTLQGRVTVRLRSEAEAVLLQVEDTGVGIPGHELPKLFERFHRVEGTQGRTHEGSGIGLALVQELVRLHHGSIEVQSVLQQGSTFSVRIPFGTAHLPRERLRETRAAVASTAIGSQAFVQEALRWLPDRSGTPAESLHRADGEPADHQIRFASTLGARIVLADDNADMRSYLRELLQPYYSVEAVPDGEAALAAVRRERAALLLTDVMMPKLDGFGLLRQVRADAALRGVPVVLLSARAGEEARVEGIDAGADDYLVKPFSARELLARVGALLERNRSRALIAYRNAQYETLFDQAPLGIFVVDTDMRISEVNPTARRVFGDPRELIGQDFGQLMRTLWPKGYAQEILRLFRRTLATGESYFTAERAENRLDRQLTEYYEWQINRIRLADGRDGVVCYFRDISTHVATRKGLQQQQRELEAADRQKNEFLAMLAHELRNPLAPIRNSSEVLARTVADDPQAARAVASIERQVTHLARLVDDLLDVSRITRGRIELRRQPVQLQEIVSRAVETVEPLVRQKGQRLLLAGEPELLVDGDPERLVQCVANVLSNAAKYSDANGEIRVEARREAGFAILAISDQGVGISRELLPRIFDLFVQGDRGLDRAHGGLGIGLSIVKRVLEMHGGDITATSAGPRQGSTFVLRLPLCSQTLQEVPVAAPQKAQPCRILIVDDNEDAADSLGMVLGLDGHEVIAAYNGEQALERAQAFRPDVVLLDIGLPGVDGYEVARRMRACKPLQSVRLVAITGYGQEADRERARSAGFAFHLVKPLEFAALQEILVPAENANVPGSGVGSSPT
jgi:PAS domain S-box-containing protein